MKFFFLIKIKYCFKYLCAKASEIANDNNEIDEWKVVLIKK